jgi:hypothetical protein
MECRDNPECQDQPECLQLECQACREQMVHPAQGRRLAVAAELWQAVVVLLAGVRKAALPAVMIRLQASAILAAVV